MLFESFDVLLCVCSRERDRWRDRPNTQTLIDLIRGAAGKISAFKCPQ